MNFEISQSTLTKQLKDFIYKEFAEHAIAIIGFNGLDSDPIVFESRENEGVIGVCVCQLFWGNLHIKYLLTKKEFRGQGIARKLIERALVFGIEKGCRFAFVETMSFQAPEFYQKLGFKVELKRDGYASNTAFYYLRRDL